MGVKRETAERREGHGDNSIPSAKVRKGTYLQVGSVVPLAHGNDTPVSVNVKSKHEGGGEKHA
jgi:hypothetical protein